MKNLLVENIYTSDNRPIRTNRELSKKAVFFSPKLLLAFLIIFCSCEEKSSIEPDQFQETFYTQEEISLIKKRESLIIKYFGSEKSFNEAVHKALDTERIDRNKVAWSGEESSALVLGIFKEKASAEDFEKFKQIHYYNK